jgi:hypothetical protein
VSNEIRLYEGENVAYTITVKRAGTAVDLTAHEASGSVVMFARDKDSAEGTNIVNGVACTFPDAANGQVAFTFTSTHTAIASATNVTGFWALKLNDGAGTIEKTKIEDFEILKDPFQAV